MMRVDRCYEEAQVVPDGGIQSSLNKNGEAIEKQNVKHGFGGLNGVVKVNDILKQYISSSLPSHIRRSDTTYVITVNIF